MNNVNNSELFWYIKRKVGIAACIALYIVGKISGLYAYKNDKNHSNDGRHHCHYNNGN